MSEIKILHLSDLHYDSKKPKDTKIVLNALWKDLDNFPAIDFIMFSGDLVKAGDKKDDFEKAYQAFIKPLLDKTSLNEEKFFLVPGNHDIQRSKIRKVIECGLKDMLKDRDSLNEFLDDEIENGFESIERLDHFNDFKGRFKKNNTVASNKLFSTHKIKKKYISIGIACLNTCWRATGNGECHDKGGLLIGERQIDASLEDIRDCDIKIALYHHPLDWLIEYDQSDTESRFSSEFDFIFSGHLHKPNLKLVQHFENKAVLVQGGCLYKSRSYFNGYSVLCFEVQKGKGTVYLRSYFDDRKTFDKAINICKNGEISISLEREKLKKKGKIRRQTKENIGTPGENRGLAKENTKIYKKKKKKKNTIEFTEELVEIIEKEIPYPDGRTLFGSLERKDEGNSYLIGYLIKSAIKELDLEKPKSDLSDQGEKKVGKYQTNYLFLHLSVSFFKESSALSKNVAKNALEIIERARGEFPDNPEIEYLLARLFYMGDFYDEAYKAISRFYKVNKDDASPLIAQIEEIQNLLDRH